MFKVKTAEKGNWKVHGINAISSDSIYEKVKTAIEEDNLTEQHLQEVTGHKYTITIDRLTRTITFRSF